ncbi:MAG: DNA polymerase [Lachnospiraceae bacterium]|jgi:DNA polymerase|nr:DNA polymerase [Lachnospiraceae bacterium]MCH4028734.1 DNA polymerase [Lachnospiraceae bacterium]MCH4066584.1 DNA polymerase [Lachnospiraceae bacterium]MCH4112614.1 DNA polymerase [Lachnospiraceae bacterium]MCI1353781.1 DNA polymerase [Lachnospiraceae bacterium]
MDKIRKLSIDLETYSPEDLKKCGVYRYSESPEFAILLFGVSVNDSPVTVYDIASDEEPPDEILEALTDNSVEKWAYNASFERVCLSVWLRRHHPGFFKGYGAPDDSVKGYLDPAGWKCSRIWGAYNGLPLSLEMIGTVLGFEQQKLKEGKDLIRYFCSPCKPTKVNGGRTRNYPSDAPDKWALFKKYNQRDVEVEMQIQKRLKNYPVPDSVWEEYHIDQMINDRGILCDTAVVKNAIKIDALTKADLMQKLQRLTGLENPNSVTQMKDWLARQGVAIGSLGKKEVVALLQKDLPENVRSVLGLRQMLAKSSVKKYQAMQNAMCLDHRCRGMFQFYGANRSGRFAGRIVQLQNLPQNHLPDLEQARNLVRQNNYAALEMLYDNVPQVLSELIRTAFIPKPGMKFVVSDYSSIEARVLAYLAGETHTIESFARGEDLYCATASAMFHKPVVKHGINGELRQKGKIATLACGYGGSVGALKAMGALDMGLKEEELQPIVTAWREANPHIVKYWRNVDAAVMKAVRLHLPSQVGSVYIYYQSGMLFIKLPSGRRLSYVQPRIGQNQFGNDCATYMGIDQQHWSRIESYGPKFVENIVQGVARDILCFAMKNLRDRFIVGHVHDELIIEVPKETNMQEICDIMGQTPDWMPGLLLRADGYECMFYQKD